MELGIKGHSTRGDEVIKLLEMLGGKNCYRLTGNFENSFYRISIYNDIVYSYIGPDEIKGYEIFSLEDFLEKYPYKVGDKVHIYVQNDDIDGMYDIEVAEITSMRWNPAHCKIAYKMEDINREFFKEEIGDKVNDDEENLFHTTNEYEEIVEKSFQGGYEKCKLDIQLNGYNLPDGYHFTDGNGNVIDTTKILIKKNSPTYPKDYIECCKVLNYTYEQGITMRGVTEEEEELFRILIVLKRCRDAYWKIAGEELGLDKPWEPVWDESEDLYTIHTFNGEIRLSGTAHRNAILVFPTEEMRDTFDVNFEYLIEDCKELL